MAKQMPSWLEAIVIKAIKEFVPASLIAEAFEAFKKDLFAKARAAAASTDNSLDDAIVDKIEAALGTCSPDTQFICDLIEKGEDAVIAYLKGVAASTPTAIDDAAVDLLAQALKS